MNHITKTVRLLMTAAVALTSAATSAHADSAMISPGDLIEMTVFQEPDMTVKTRVSPGGTITLPLLREVTVSGRTTDAAASFLRDRLMKGYFVNPQVTLTVLEFAKRQFTVIGQVQKGGTFDFPDGQTTIDLLAAIGMAGGYTRIADPRKVTVTRFRDGKEEIARVDAKAVAEGKVKNMAILPGDAVSIGESIF